MTEAEPGTGEGQPADDIRSALASAIAAQEPVADAPAKPEPEVKEPVEEPEAKRVRGPDGKFVAKTEGEEPAVKEPAEAKTPEKPDAEAEPEKKPEVASKEPPANWSVADKATFKAMPEAAQQFLLKRHKDMEADHTRKTQAISALKTEYEPVDQLFAPYKDAMKAKGFSPRTLIESWARVETELSSGPDRAVAIIKGLATGYNIPVAKIAMALGIKAGTTPEQQVGEAPPAPEHVQAQLPPELLERLSKTESFIQSEQQRRATEAQARLREGESRVMSEIETFKSASDKQGNLLHPHFDDVEDHMTALANAALAMKQPVPPLNDLYETAVWANPSTREKVRTAETQAAEKKRAEEARAKAAAAKKASASVTGAPGAGQAPSGRRGSELSLREQLLEAAEESADA